MNRKYIKEIIKSNEENKLAIFIGSGISKCIEHTEKMPPNWNELMEKINEYIGNSEEKDYLKIAEFFYLKCQKEGNINNYYEKIYEWVGSDIKPSQVHKKIFEINPSIIITTNWDNVLEETIKENGLIYEVIRSDEELINTKLNKKVIKMHGDFKNNNIVFREDDYINYKNKFPLIENYIKSILSTHTILFLGYSYNDINLKQITKWIQEKSGNTPKMYLAKKIENEHMKNYYESHGIKSLDMELPKEMNKIFDEETNTVLNLLKQINKEEDIYNLYSDEEIVDYYYEKIIKLDKYEKIFHLQIKDIFDNFHYKYTDKGDFIIHFNTHFSSNKSSDIQKKFFKIVENNHEYLPKLNKILQILNRANIKGLSHDGMHQQYFDFSNSIEKIEEKADKGIKQISSEAFREYKNKNYEKALEITENLIMKAIEEENLVKLFIAKINKNNLYQLIDSNRFNPLFKNKIEDIEKQFYYLNHDTRKIIENVLSDNFLYKEFIRVNNILEKKVNNKKNVENGGMNWSAFPTEEVAKHKNFIEFMLENEIMWEHNYVYREINKAYLKINLVRQFNYDNILLNKQDIITVIDYTEHKKNYEIFKDYYLYDSYKKGKLQISEEDKKFILENYISKIEKKIELNKQLNSEYIECLKNSLFLLSLVRLSESEIEIIIKIFLLFLSKDKENRMEEVLNFFISCQYNFYEIKFNSTQFNGIIEMLIVNVIESMSDSFPIKIQNIFIDKLCDSKFSNVEIIEKLINTLMIAHSENNMEIIMWFCFALYIVVDNSIKLKMEKEIFNKVSFGENELSEYNAVYFKLNMIIHGIEKYERTILDRIKGYITLYKDSDVENIGIVVENELGNLKNQIGYLVENNGEAKGLENIHKEIIEMISKKKEQRKKINMTSSNI